MFLKDAPILVLDEATSALIATSSMPSLYRHADLVAGGDTLNSALNLAFIGDASYGLVIVRDIPGFAAARHAAMNDTVRLARADHL